MNKRKPILGTWQVTLPKAYSACRVPKIGFFMTVLTPEYIKMRFDRLRASRKVNKAKEAEEEKSKGQLFLDDTLVKIAEIKESESH